jgi:hypothetical protein
MQKLNKILRQNLEDVMVSYFQKDSDIRLQETRNNQTPVTTASKTTSKLGTS